MITTSSKSFIIVDVKDDIAKSLVSGFFDNPDVTNLKIRSTKFDTDIEAIHFASTYTSMMTDVKTAYNPLYLPNQGETVLKTRILAETEETFSLARPFEIVNFKQGDNEVSVQYSKFELPPFSDIIEGNTRVLS